MTRVAAMSMQQQREREQMPFKFQMGQRAKLKESGEEGEIMGRAEYKAGQDTYLLRYKAGDGRQVESWWTEDALVGT